MSVIHRSGTHIIKFTRSQIFIFQFVGHLSQTAKDMLLGKLTINWSRLWVVVYFSGVRLVIPLIIISALLSISIAQMVYVTLSPFHLQKQVLPIAQSILTREFLPIFIGLILCIQSAVRFIDTKTQQANQTGTDALTEQVIPIMIGVSLTSIFLFAYAIGAVILSFYLVFHYKLSLSTYEFISHILSARTRFELIYSAFKTLILSFVVAIVAGFYYFESAVNHTTLSKAVSRTMTRGIFWLIVTSLYMTFLL
ncbi:ABC transporter permease [Legionella sp. W05-934-2]|uniref:ABC transporter permease n=1 Tax=Legionella sp. W05-934-2 TaxID=1198649 RepID=UPI003461BDD9